MQRQGYQPIFHIGVARTQGTISAHAWVEYDRQVVMGQLGNLDQFVPLLSEKTL